MGLAEDEGATGGLGDLGDSAGKEAVVERSNIHVVRAPCATIVRGASAPAQRRADSGAARHLGRRRLLGTRAAAKPSMTKHARSADADEALDDAAQGTAPTVEPSDADETLREVDAIGAAAGVSVSDRTPLGGEDPIAKRDAHRWELDPASAEDAKDRMP